MTREHGFSSQKAGPRLFGHGYLRTARQLVLYQVPFALRLLIFINDHATKTNAVSVFLPFIAKKLWLSPTFANAVFAQIFCCSKGFLAGVSLVELQIEFINVS